MLQRLIRQLLSGAAAMRTNSESFIRISLQRDDDEDASHDTPPSAEPYIFDLDVFDDHMQGSFFASLDQLGEEDHFEFPYRIGEAIDFARHMSPFKFDQFKRNLDSALIDGDGKAHSLVLVCDGLPHRDFAMHGIRFHFESNGVFRARPLFLFIQAYPKQ